MMRLLFSLLALLVLAASAPWAARAQQTTIWTESFPSGTYGTNVPMPQNPWFQDNTLSAPPHNMLVNETAAPSTGLTCNFNGGSSKGYRSFGTTITSGEITITQYLPASGTNMLCETGVDNTVSGNNYPEYMVGWYLGVTPPAGSFGVQMIDCAAATSSEIDVLGGVPHVFDLTFRCQGLISDFTTLKIDGVVVKTSAAMSSLSFIGFTIQSTAIFAPDTFVSAVSAFNGLPAVDDTGGVSLIQ